MKSKDNEWRFADTINSFFHQMARLDDISAFRPKNNEPVKPTKDKLRVRYYTLPEDCNALEDDLNCEDFVILNHQNKILDTGKIVTVVYFLESKPLTPEEMDKLKEEKGNESEEETSQPASSSDSSDED